MGKRSIKPLSALLRKPQGEDKVKLMIIYCPQIYYGTLKLDTTDTTEKDQNIFFGVLIEFMT